jgi:hypothetical protein
MKLQKLQSRHPLASVAATETLTWITLQSIHEKGMDVIASKLEDKGNAKTEESKICFQMSKICFRMRGKLHQQ